MSNAYEILMGKTKGKRPLGRPEVDGWIILKCILEKYGGVVWTELVWLRIMTSGGPL
jgi:hypothetical protein